MKNAIIKTLIVFLILTSLSGLLISKSFQRDMVGIKGQALDTSALQAEKIEIYLKDLLIKIGLWQKYFESWDEFSEEEYRIYARYFTLLAPSVQAFNYVDSESMLIHTYPSKENIKALGRRLLEHPDSEIRNLFIKGMSQENVTFSPPVDIFQGGKAIIFYAPVKFKNGDHGWQNIVIRIDKLLSIFLMSNARRHSSISIIDKETGRYFYKGFEQADEDHVVRSELEFEGRTLMFETDISLFAGNLKEKYTDFLLYIVFILFLLSLSLYFYFRKIDEVQSSLINAKSEKNLLRIMFHDLSNPLSVVQLYAYDLAEKNPEEASLPKMLKRIQQMIEIISSIRHLDYLNRDVSEMEKKRINFNELFEDLLQINQDLIAKKNLKVEFKNQKNLELMLRIPFELLKNEIINNLLGNAIKFSKESSTIEIEVLEDKLIITNISVPISADVLDDLNMIRPTESRAVSHSTKGHGLGFFIAKILSKKFNLALRIEQDKEKQEVRTILGYWRSASF
ncbi:MAG: signal transduction histidine kinase [Bacteriovoracaceae bacterium]|jgi:signal transduction histidine kinase